MKVITLPGVRLRNGNERDKLKVSGNLLRNSETPESESESEYAVSISEQGRLDSGEQLPPDYSEMEVDQEAIYQTIWSTQNQCLYG